MDSRDELVRDGDWGWKRSGGQTLLSEEWVGSEARGLSSVVMDCSELRSSSGTERGGGRLFVSS